MNNSEKMTLEEILEVSANISNSIWNMRKNGELNSLTEEEFQQLYDNAGELYSSVGWAILGFVPIKNGENNE